jgi:hypothetical protein
VLFASDGFLSPGVDDILRLAIFVLVALNIVVLLFAVRTLRLATRLLLDVEQFAREVRSRREN